MFGKLIRAIILPIVTISVASCAGIVPSFDVPTTDEGVPVTTSITRRVICELIDLVRDDLPEERQYRHKYSLLHDDYQVALLLTLDKNDTGGLAPSLSFIQPQFLFDANFAVSQSREDSLNINLSYSMRDLARAFTRREGRAICPEVDTYLAGNLGLKRSISGALESTGLITQTTVTPTSGEFSGAINFTITRKIVGLGPTILQKDFKGPGQLISVSSVGNDKLSYGFATGKNAGTPFDPRRPASPTKQYESRAQVVLDRQLSNEAITQLSAIRNILQ
ncbi:hypothetical protein R1A27_28280 [Methylobacterium sp. NMS12]|uniref:hypothetical protein n=1 Tax=Methylobacterium sp. NMS12 TaxID=3079766 RepID=UPI003F884199